jgi:D-glycero-alpha-D-manno-heptose-7-phosphate kinase
VGWKVNGAGGDGGSLTVLCGNDIGDKRELGNSLLEVNPHFQLVPTRLDSHGLRVWESRP